MKKSSLSRTLTLNTYVSVLSVSEPVLIIQSSNTPPENLDQATISARTNGQPVYDAAYLSQLKANMQSTRPPMPDLDVSDADVSMSAEVSVIDALDISSELFSASVLLVLNSAVVSDVPIPSQSSIQAAKEKRERLRLVGQEDDYISLTVATRNDVYQGPHPESRLMREEDDLGEGDDGR